MPPTPTDLDGLGDLIALKTPQSETGANDKIQNTTKVWGRQQGRDCCILTEIILKIHHKLSEIPLNAYHQPEAE
jgi:hypothetical protein